MNLFQPCAPTIKKHRLLKILLATALLTATAAGGAHADSPGDSRIKILTYSDDDVYAITTKYGYQTNIVFSKGEQIQTVSVGDRSLWQLIPSGNRLFIRPMVYGVETNMTLLTNKHSYQFDLKSLPDQKSEGNIYVARFIYPDEASFHPASANAFPPAGLLAEAALNQPAPAPRPAPAAAPVPTPKPVAAAPGIEPLLKPNYNYTYTGPDDAAPERAYDDGKSTFIQYRENQPLPSVYVIDAKGKAQEVSYNISNDLIVINRIAGEWLLKENGGTVHLYNETLNPK